VRFFFPLLLTRFRRWETWQSFCLFCRAPLQKMGSISSDLVHFGKQLQLHNIKWRDISLYALCWPVDSPVQSHFDDSFHQRVVRGIVYSSPLNCLLLFWLVTSVLTSWTAITIRFQQARSSWVCVCVCWIPLPICHSCVSLVSSLLGRWKKIKKKTNHTTSGKNQKGQRTSSRIPIDTHTEKQWEILVVT
jgi:hypothetical protein